MMVGSENTARYVRRVPAKIASLYCMYQKQYQAYQLVELEIVVTL